MKASVEASLWICTPALWHPGPIRPRWRHACSGRTGKLDAMQSRLPGDPDRAPGRRRRRDRSGPASSGLATARAVQRADPGLRVVVVDKEGRWRRPPERPQLGRRARRASTTAPGSQKAELCRTGRAELLDWCDRHDVAWRRCGKVVVATRADELRPTRRARATGPRPTASTVHPARSGRPGRHRAPRGRPGRAARARDRRDRLRARCATRWSAGIERRGGVVAVGCEVPASSGERPSWSCAPRRGEVRGDRGWPTAPGCRATGWPARPATIPAASILAFRGEYHELVPLAPTPGRGRSSIPVPDPRFPFLGVHLTRALDGSVHAGPERGAGPGPRGLPPPRRAPRRRGRPGRRRADLAPGRAGTGAPGAPRWPAR